MRSQDNLTKRDQRDSYLGQYLLSVYRFKQRDCRYVVEDLPRKAVQMRHNLNLISLDEKAMLDLIGSSETTSLKRIKKIKKLFKILKSPLSNLQIARQLDIHGPGKKHIGSFLAPLVESGVLVKKNSLYHLAALPPSDNHHEELIPE